MTHSPITNASSDVPFLDNECSNRMSKLGSLLKDLNEMWKIKLRLGDDKQVKVEGKGPFDTKTIHGNVKLLYDVQFMPSLPHNLLNVGKLMLVDIGMAIN